jgi:hypothetical protein
MNEQKITALNPEQELRAKTLEIAAAMLGPKPGMNLKAIPLDYLTLAALVQDWILHGISECNTQSPSNQNGTP